MSIVAEYGKNEILQGDALELAKTLPGNSIHCIVTSPPYWGLRDYGVSDQLGLEPTPEAYIEKMVTLFRELRRALHPSGTLWLNMGDSYANTKVGNTNEAPDKRPRPYFENGTHKMKFAKSIPDGLKPKDLIGIPWRLALALQADGWYLRSDIIWCLSGGNRVYAKTQKGEMPMTIKDLVRLKPETVKLWNGEKWTQVLGWSETPRPADPIELELRSGERIGCTPSHQWPTQRGMVKAQDLQVGDVIQTCKLPDRIGGESPEFIPDDIGWLVGLYLAEGSTGKHNSVIQIASHQKEQERFIRLQEIATAYGGTCQMHKTSENGATINLYGRVLFGIIEQYISGKTSHDKHLTVNCWQRSDAFLWQVLSGYLDGDGHYDQRNDRWRIGFTRNYNLEQDLRTLCARLGIQLRLKLAEATNQHGTFKAFRGEIRFNRSEHHNTKQDGEIVRIGRSRARKVWDIGVEDSPHLFALASGILTHNSKPNPMPESVTDRPTKAHEYIFLMTKSARYFYDAESIRVATSENSHSRGKAGQPAMTMPKMAAAGSGIKNNDSFQAAMKDLPEGYRRNRRTVWTVATQPYAEAHFATFPPKLIEPCILAGSSAKGVCPECGNPWERVVERETFTEVRDKPTGKAVQSDEQDAARRLWERTRALRANGRNHDNPFGHTTTTGWRPTCECDYDPIPATVLDPFMGSGTTAMVAIQHHRNWLGFELNAEYIELAYKRLANVQLALPMDTTQQLRLGDG